jgi:hypothetical protein
MKRCIKALVTISTAVLVLAGASAAAYAVSPVVKLKASAALSKRSTGRSGSVVRFAKLHVHVVFATDTLEAPLLTLEQAKLLFPDHAGTNGRLFPSCSARQIERFHGDIRRCPNGSKIGGGTVDAQLFALGITVKDCPVTMFNGPHGKSITFHVEDSRPARINESFDAPLTMLHDRRYGEQIVLRDPPSLMQPLPGVYVGVQDFNVTAGATARVHGVTYSYFKARTCPTWAIHGVFDFTDPASGQPSSTTADTKVRCRAR